MGLSSTIIYTSELILCSTICVPSATRHNIHMTDMHWFTPFAVKLVNEVNCYVGCFMILVVFLVCRNTLVVLYNRDSPASFRRGI